MSQLLCRIAKLSLSSSIWKKKEHGLCLRSLSTAATPYLLFNPTDKKEITKSGAQLNLYDPSKGETVIIPNQTLTNELLTSMIKGSSRGWVLAQNKVDLALRLTNMYNNPCASRKVISLPPTKEKLWRISLSASPDQDQEDCVVAALSTDSSLIMCRPGDSEWTPIKTPFFASGMIYSARDAKFYLGTRVGHEYVGYHGPIDLIDTSSGFPQVSLFQEFPFSEFPESRVENLLTASKTDEHIVQSPSGESFIIYWFNYAYLNKEFKAKPPYQSSIRSKPRGFVVFKQDPEQRINSYTEDIGDLCIFLGYNEAFCVSATEYPGLNPNSIYFTSRETGYGFYDLSSNTLHEVVDPPPFSYCHHWLPPSPVK
ncbi:hypothetical protein AALP_AA6G004200 [Arabis alpina]|uniref:KIB1-4 beta-propeller domain-containing protein n=1 Tax=Arabis alpina TaxID=50452 RepID=A0A087GL60_ARAAL|nr:hypothetical protein AALP_AA6G004200 [Arabis alpina]